MKNPFQRARQPAVRLDNDAGAGVIAARMASRGGVVPPGCVGVLVDASGPTRRCAEGARVTPAAGESAWCFHPGPYNVMLTPFVAAPELGLQLRVVVDSPDPLAAQQRFDLFLASEGDQAVTLAGFNVALDTALQCALAQGHLDLPPCTQPDEWNAFRAGLNELLYMRFGVTVDECIPVDLAGQVDYAALLAARAAETPAVLPVALPAAVPVAAPPVDDAAALRRLFLELPVLTRRVRLLDANDFARQRMLVQRLDLASLAVLTMPALALAAPGRALPAGAQQRRARHLLRATAALDEAWAWLARAPQLDHAGISDNIERIVANLDDALAARRATEAA